MKDKKKVDMRVHTIRDTDVPIFFLIPVFGRNPGFGKKIPGSYFTTSSILGQNKPVFTKKMGTKLKKIWEIPFFLPRYERNGAYDAGGKTRVSKSRPTHSNDKTKWNTLHSYNSYRIFLFVINTRYHCKT